MAAAVVPASILRGSPKRRAPQDDGSGAFGVPKTTYSGYWMPAFAGPTRGLNRHARHQMDPRQRRRFRRRPEAARAAAVVAVTAGDRREAPRRDPEIGAGAGAAQFRLEGNRRRQES